MSVSNADTIVHDRTNTRNVWPTDMDVEAPPGTRKHIGDAAVLDDKQYKMIAVCLWLWVAMIECSM